MFGRGRGTPNANDRRSVGNTRDVRTTPQSRQYGGKPDNSPRGGPKKDDPPKDDQITKDSPRPGGNKGGRTRSRSPVDRSTPKEDRNAAANSNSVPADDATAEGAQSDKKKEEQPKSFRYTGRPGEKKFSGRCRLFVANLHNTTTEDELKELFGDFGDTGEVYVNKEKGFGFIRLDYRHNAEIAKLTLDKKLLKGRNIQVRYATHASAIELHGLDNYASNEFIEKAMSTFGAVERCIVVCDDRGRSKGYAIVEFEWKKSAAKVLDRLKDEMFVLGRLPKPVFAKPYILTDEAEGIHEEALERMEGLEQEREHQPRFISPNSFEYTWAKRWRDLFIEEQDKKARLEQEMIDARAKLEFEMEAAIRQQASSRIREELARRQEELRMLEEDMMRRQEADIRILERSRQRELAARTGRPELAPMEDTELHNNEIQLSRENAARQQDFAYLRQKAEMTLQSENISNIGGIMPEILGAGGGFGGRGQPQPGGYPGNYAGMQQGGRHAGGIDYRNQQRGPPREMQGRDIPRDLPSRDMPARDIPARDLPRDLPRRESYDLPSRETPSKDKMGDKNVDSPAAKPAEVESTKRPRR